MNEPPGAPHSDDNKSLLRKLTWIAGGLAFLLFMLWMGLMAAYMLR